MQRVDFICSYSIQLIFAWTTELLIRVLCGIKFEQLLNHSFHLRFRYTSYIIREHVIFRFDETMDYLDVNQTTNQSTGGKEITENYQNFYMVMREITGIYLFPFISIFGILGNIFIIIVYANSKIYSTNLYLISLAMSDILKLLNDFTYFLVMFIYKFDTKLGDTIFHFLYNYTHYIFVFTALTNSW